jgi:hypothetical protein
MFREHKIQINYAYAWILSGIERCALCTAVGRSQAAANFAERLCVPELAEQHGHELAPAGETPSVPPGFVLPYCRFEFQTGKKLQNLQEYAAYTASPNRDWFFAETPISTYQRLSFFRVIFRIRNLDKSDPG